MSSAHHAGMEYIHVIHGPQVCGCSTSMMMSAVMPTGEQMSAEDRPQMPSSLSTHIFLVHLMRG